MRFFHSSCKARGRLKAIIRPVCKKTRPGRIYEPLGSAHCPMQKKEEPEGRQCLGSVDRTGRGKKMQNYSRQHGTLMWGSCLLPLKISLHTYLSHRHSSHRNNFLIHIFFFPISDYHFIVIVGRNCLCIHPVFEFYNICRVCIKKWN